MARNMFKPLTDDGSESWPLSHVLSAAAAANDAATAPYNNQRCVVITTGAMSPTHRGHVAMLHAARKALEERGFAVLGGYLSPSHDLYVGPKAEANGTLHVEARHRVVIAELITADLPWISVAKWEARQEGRWPNFPEVSLVCEKFLKEKKAQLGGVITVFYVCGVDHFRKCRLYNGMRGRLGLVVIPRDGERRGEDNPGRGLYWADAPDEFQNFSSTSAREALQANGSNSSAIAQHMLGAAVVGYIRQHGLYGAAPVQDFEGMEAVDAEECGQNNMNQRKIS